jgi:hypothetical protein
MQVFSQAIMSKQFELFWIKAQGTSNQNLTSRNSGTSNDALLYAIELLDAAPHRLNSSQREHQAAAKNMFATMSIIAADPTDRPLYSTVNAVNILPRRLRSRHGMDHSFFNDSSHYHLTAPLLSSF